jgi:hypothetical protein
MPPAARLIGQRAAGGRDLQRAARLAEMSSDAVGVGSPGQFHPLRTIVPLGRADAIPVTTIAPPVPQQHP